MLTSRCPDCGAVIGGAGHLSAEGNEPANDFLRGMARASI